MKPLSLSFLNVGLVHIIFCASSFAADAASVTAAVNTAPVNLFQTIISLVLIVGVLIGLSVLFKKFGLNRIQANLPIKIIGTVHLGNNQRLMVMETDEEWVVLGVTPHHISTLTSMPRQETQDAPFIDNSSQANAPVWLKNIVKKYQSKS